MVRQVGPTLGHLTNRVTRVNGLGTPTERNAPGAEETTAEPTGITGYHEIGQNNEFCQGRQIAREASGFKIVNQNELKLPEVEPIE